MTPPFEMYKVKKQNHCILQMTQEAGTSPPTSLSKHCYCTSYWAGSIPLWHNMLFLQEETVNPCPNPKLEDQSLSVTAYSLLFATWELVPSCGNNGAT